MSPATYAAGKRYNRETLEVKYKGYSIADLLAATVEEAVGVLENIPQIAVKLKTLNDVGLGYVHLEGNPRRPRFPAEEAQGGSSWPRSWSRRQTGAHVLPAR